MAHHIRIAKRDIPLAFTLGTMESIEEAIEGMSMANIDQVVKSTKNLITIIALMAKTAAELDGKPCDIDRQWVANHCPVNGNFIAYATATVINVIIDGMQMESDDEVQTREVDVVLEQLKKKETKEE